MARRAPILYQARPLQSDLSVRQLLLEMNHKLDLLLRGEEASLQNEETLMSQADDLNNVVTALGSGFVQLDAAVQAEIAEVQSLLAGSAVDPKITLAISNIGTITNKMATDAAALTASVPAATTVPPPPPAPAPVVTPTVTPPVIATPPVTAPTAQPPSTPPPSAVTQPAA